MNLNRQLRKEYFSKLNTLHEKVCAEGSNDNAVLTKTFMQINSKLSADDVRDLVKQTLNNLNKL